MFWDSFGNTAGVAEIMHSRPVMYQMDENHVSVKRIMRSGTVVGIRLGMLKSYIRPVMHQMDGNHVFVKRIICSGRVLGMRLGMLISSI